jgi:hypothetical protein
MAEEYSDNVVYNYKSFEITLIKQSESVTIRCLETRLYKIYEEIYNLRMIEMFNVHNIDNFYIILNKSVEHLIKTCSNNIDIDADDEKTNIKVICSENVIVLKINLNYFMLQFNFELEINLSETLHMTGQDLVIKKLEKEISELQLFMENMPFIVMNNMLSVSINAQYVNFSSCTNQCLLPLNTNHLKLCFLPNYQNVNNNNNENINHINLYNDLTQKFNANLKLIKIKTLYLINANYDFGYENLPDSIEHIQLTFTNNTFLKSCKKFLIDRELPNLHTIEFINCDCNTVQLVNSTYINFVQPLNLKKIIVKNVIGFNEEGLLKSNRIKCVVIN